MFDSRICFFCMCRARLDLYCEAYVFYVVSMRAFPRDVCKGMIMGRQVKGSVRE